MKRQHTSLVRRVRARFGFANTALRSLAGSLAAFTATVLAFIDRLGPNWLNRMGAFLKKLAHWRNITFVHSMAETVAHSFANLLPEQLQRFGLAYVAECLRREKLDHGVTTSKMESATGLRNTGGRRCVRARVCAHVCVCVCVCVSAPAALACRGWLTAVHHVQGGCSRR